jgi:signal transduction histidine kinase
LRRVVGRLPAELVSATPHPTIMVANMGLANEWRGRIYLFDVTGSDNLERRVHFLEVTTEHITPALTNVILLRRLHSQVSAAERARVARELHDGAIQALIGIEMQIEALRREAPRGPDEHASELGDVQALVRQEVLALRDLMQALRPVEVDAHEKLPEVLASVVERFRRNSGVSARFVADGAPPSLHPATAIEIVRIVQEALVNVRKHSQANNVLVRLTQDNGRHRLVVEDDGRGFDFSGTLPSAELDARRVGPAIIKERARVIGADLTVHSEPGVGARIEITLS